MATTKIPAELVAVNAIQGTLIADNAITAVHIATNAISGTLIADNAITSTHIAENNVTATQIAMNTITVTQVADNAITTPKIIADAVTGAKIANDSIDSEHLVDGSIDTAHIGDVQVTAAKLGDNAVTLAKMASLARGSVIVGDAAGDPAALAIGSNTYVLSSDGTDIAWAANDGITTINNNADNRVITGSGTANTLNGESGLTYDGTTLIVSGVTRIDNSATTPVRLQLNNSGSNDYASIYADTPSAYKNLIFNPNGGNVGIGTSSPPHKLSVFGTGAGNATVQIEGEGGADPYINFLANNTQHWSLGIDDSDSDKFKISEHSGLGTNDYLVVDTSGNVGIGGTPHASGRLLISNNGTNQIVCKPGSGSTNLNMGNFSGGGYISNNYYYSSGHQNDDSSLGSYEMYMGPGDNIAFNYMAAGSPGTRRKDLVIDNANGGRVGIGTSSPTSKLHVESGSAHNKLSITSTASGGTGYDAVIDLLGSASNSECAINMGINGDADREQIKTYQSTMFFRTNNAENMRITSDGVSMGDTAGDYTHRGATGGLHVKRGGILMNGPPGDAVMASAAADNQWTYHGQGGRSGSFTSVYFSIPNPNGGASGYGYGGFSVEFYIAGYNAKYHSGHYSGYVNGGLTQGGSGFYATSGSASIAAVSIGAQGFKITVSFPQMTHPTAKFIVNKGGHGITGIWTDMDGAAISWA